VVEKDVTVWKEAAGSDGLTILDDLSTGFFIRSSLGVRA